MIMGLLGGFPPLDNLAMNAMMQRNQNTPFG